MNINYYILHSFRQRGGTVIIFCNSMNFLQCGRTPGMTLIFYNALAVFVYDATMYIYDDSIALEEHSC